MNIFVLHNNPIVAAQMQCDKHVVKMTNFVQAMPEQYKQTDPVEAYRKYYLGEKASFAKWTKRKAPDWFIKCAEIEERPSLQVS